MSPVVLYVLLAVAIVVAIVIAVAALGLDRFVTVWEAIPGPIRTLINVAAGAAVTAGGSALVAALTGSPVDLPTLWQAVLVAVSTAVVRFLNPLDTSYGTNTPTPVGAHDPAAIDGQAATAAAEG